MNKVIFLTFLFFTNYSFGQFSWTDATVVLKSGEVLEGEAKITKHKAEGMFKIKLWRKRDKLKFRTEKGAKKQKYKAEEVESITFSNQFFSKEFVPVYLKKGVGKPVFMLKVFKGEFASLYERETYYNYQDASGYSWRGYVGEFWVEKDVTFDYRRFFAFKIL